MQNYINENLEEEILEEFPPYEVELLTKEEVLSDMVMDYLISLRDSSRKVRAVEAVKEKAREFKVARAFNNIFKERSKELAVPTDGNLGGIVFPEMNNIVYNTNKYMLDEKGAIYEFSPVLGKILVCYHPILPLEKYENLEDGSQKIKIGYYINNIWKTIIVDKSTISSSQSIVKLSDFGINVTSENAKFLIRYLSEIENLNLDKIRTNVSVSRLGWFGESFIPYSSTYEYDGDISYKYLFKSITQKGDYEQWKEEMRKLRQESKTLRFMMAASFASPLVEFFKINTFIVHLWGKSGNGKTLTEMVCASIWGNPAKGKLLVTLNSTQVAFERQLNFLRNFPLFIDELQITKEKDSDYDKIIYELTEGKGRDRGTKDGGLAQSTEWSNIIFLSGEEPITSPLSKEGVKNRVIEIEENEKIIKNGNNVANFIFNNYGYSAKDFIEIIKTENKNNLIEEYKRITKELNKYTKYDKQIYSLAIIFVADKIISEKIFNDKPLSLEESKKYFSKDIDECDRYINLIIDTANSNINNFYELANKEELPKGKVWGKIEKNNTGDILFYYFIPNKLVEILKQHNINWDSIKKKMAEKGYIEKSSDGKYQVSTKSLNGNQRMIKIKNIY